MKEVAHKMLNDKYEKWYE